MIRINLLPQKRSKKADAGQQTLGIGFGVLALVGAAVYLLVHMPMQNEIDEDKKINSSMKVKIKTLKDKTKDFEKLEAAFKAAQAQQDAIERLRSARAVPAWMLHELASILTKDRNPTMTADMAKRVMEDPNRAWVQGWDPKHVWVTKFVEKGGRFQLYGGAQSDSDMTQLALRLQASVYFKDVLPQTGAEVKDKAGGISFYNFQITGRVVY